MEGRLRVLFLTVAVGLLSGCGMFRTAEQLGTSTEVPVQADGPVESASVITPEVERREPREAKIDTENWEIGGYIGSISVEDFEVNVVYGARAAYHISEDFFAEAIYGTADAGLTSFERLSGSSPLLTDSERRFKYYSLGFGWNVLPGEVFLGGKRALNSAVYLTVGAGSTAFAGDDRFTLTLGAGARVLIKDWLAAHLGIRDHILEVDVLGVNKQTHNYEATVSLTVFF